MSNPLSFKVENEDTESAARAGVLKTAHGEIQTPIFMPVGTVGTVKAIQPRELIHDIKAQIILGNTYHLYLRPGMDVLETAGGLHRFMNWKGPILTDSGGFQVFSLSDRRTIDNDGVEFQSHLDGSKHRFTPENVIETQRSIGSDIMMVLDECPAGDVDINYARKSNELTISWAKRCQNHYHSTEEKYGHRQLLFPIVQGVIYPEVRRESAKALVDLDFEGYAIGGLSVGESEENMYAMVEVVNEILPKDKPRYLMGVGTPANLINNVSRGVDMFDCVMPTRNGRNGMIFTTEGTVNIRNEKWKKNQSPIDPGLDRYGSQEFTKSYLRHLIMSKEILGLQLSSMQNLSFYVWLMSEMRSAIVAGTFAAWKSEWLPRVSRRL